MFYETSFIQNICFIEHYQKRNEKEVFLFSMKWYTTILYLATKKALKIFGFKTSCTNKPFGCQILYSYPTQIQKVSNKNIY